MSPTSTAGQLSNLLPLAGLLLLALPVGCTSSGFVEDDDNALIVPPDDDDDDNGDDDDLTPDDDDDDNSDDDDGSELTATLYGTVTRGIDPIEDGMGDLIIRVRLAEGGGGGGGGAIAVATLPDVDLSDPGSEVDYELTDIPLSDAPYSVNARLDDNNSGGPPDDVDLRSQRIEITIDEEGDYDLDMVLTLVGGPGGGPGGDDDDSAER